MDRQQWLHMRKRRYMARMLEAFERSCEPHLPAEAAAEFKGEARRYLNALCVDGCDVMTMDEQQLNGHAQDIRDRLDLDGARPHARGASQ